MQITLAPSPLPWSSETTQAFYAALSSAPIDTIVLGETVCVQRQNLTLNEWLALGGALTAAGQAVRLATPVLVDSPAALAITQAICSQTQFFVEAGDITAVALMNQQHRSFAGSPSLSLYNAHSLNELTQLGLTHWGVPVELSRANLTSLQNEWTTTFPATSLPAAEITAYGHLMLSCSARCFTAQAYSRPRTQCGQVCQRHPTGMPVATLEDEPLFRINGPQVCTNEVHNLLPCLDELIALGVSAVRIIPFSADPASILDLVSAIRRYPAPLPNTLTQGARGYWSGVTGMSAPPVL